MLLERMKPNFEFENEKGKLTQLVREGWSQVNVITSKAGSFRGGHYHKLNKEAFYIISGKFKLTLRKDGKEEEHILGKDDMFMIEPYCMHDFDYLEDTILVSMYDKGVELENGEKDIYTE
jgi:dTDP-4-dehydrorhamnose 3,5-epimerase-like enzyme